MAVRMDHSTGTALSRLGGAAVTWVLSAVGVSVLAAPAAGQYLRRDLVSDQPGIAPNTDPNLINAWGVAFNPGGFVWVANNGTGTSSLYDGNGVPNSLVVNVPTSTESAGGNPTGIVFNGGSSFVVSNNGHSGPAAFVWA